MDQQTDTIPAQVSVPNFSGPSMGSMLSIVRGPAFQGGGVPTARYSVASVEGVEMGLGKPASTLQGIDVSNTGDPYEEVQSGSRDKVLPPTMVRGM